ncbi:MAG: NAD-dependent epimerase/dehydratase family protein [archaeon]
MKAIVTGGAGFIASHVAEGATKEGYEVVIIDNFSYGKEENLANLRKNKKVKIYKRDICEDLNDLFKDVDVVFHLAALPRVQYSIDYPDIAHKANVEGTVNLLEMSRKNKVKRFVFMSSSSIYGDQEKMPYTEDMKPNPMSPYALHKLVGEEYCNLYYRLYGLETVCLRGFNIYGPRQDPSGGYACLIPRFIQLINKNTRPTINGDGEQTRDFIYVQDVVRANLMAAKTNNKKAFGEVFNIGSGKRLSVNQVTNMILGLSKKNTQPIHGPQVIEPKNTLADIKKTKELLGWEPEYSFEQGMKETFEFFKN